MFARRKFLYIKILAALVCLILALLVFYIIKLKSAVQTNTLASIEETALHDKRAIRVSLELLLDELSGVARRLKAGDLNSVSELWNRLALESETTPFNRLLVLAEDGTIYTDRGGVFPHDSVIPGVGVNFADLINFGASDSYVTRFDGAYMGAIPDQSILYALKLRDFTVGDEKMLTLLGFTDVRLLKRQMIIDSYAKDGVARGYTAVIDEAGNFVFGAPPGNGKENVNFFTRLSGMDDTSMTKREIQTRMKNFLSFHFYLNAKGAEKMAYFSPFGSVRDEDPPWYLVTMVNDDYLTERETSILLMGLAFIGVTLVAIILMLIYGIITHNRLQNAQDARELKNRLLDSLSAEIETPLNELSKLNALIREKAGQNAPTSLLDAEGELHGYLRTLLKNFLALAKLSAASTEIRKKPFSLEETLQSLMYIYKIIAENHDVRILTHKNLLAPVIVGDEDKLRQILNYVVINLIKETSKGGALRLIIRQRRLDEEKVETEYRCLEKNRGQTSEFLDQIYGQKGRVKDDFHLGARLLTELVDAMGGSLNIDAGEGEIREIILKIPNEIFAETKALPAASRERDRTKIIFAGKLPPATTSPPNLEIIFANSGEEAAALFYNSAPGEIALIIFNLDTIADANEAAKKINELKSLGRRARIYAYMDTPDRNAILAAMKNGVGDFIPKPLDLERLLKKNGLRKS